MVSVRRLMEDFEAQTQKSLAPGEHRQVVLKVYSHSGAGLATPPALVEAVGRVLVEKGFAKEEILLLDTRLMSLRAAGFLPPLSRRGEGNHFRGHPVLALDAGGRVDQAWFYDSPLPTFQPGSLTREILGTMELEPDPDARKSFLAYDLIEGVDYWINLPVILDHPSVKLNGVLTNVTLWNVTNNARFFVSPANAPIAVAEIAAIPELLAPWAFSIVSLERYQFIGGPEFNSLYTRSEPTLWLSPDPVILDALGLERINRHRNELGFESLVEQPLMLEYAESLRLGTDDLNRIIWHRP